MTHPRTEALAYRIWAYATPRGWDVTGKDIAEALGVSGTAVGRVLHAKGWQNQTRSDKLDHNGVGPLYGPGKSLDRSALRDMGLDRMSGDDA